MTLTRGQAKLKHVITLHPGGRGNLRGCLQRPCWTFQHLIIIVGAWTLRRLAQQVAHKISAYKISGAGFSPGPFQLMQHRNVVTMYFVV